MKVQLYLFVICFISISNYTYSQEKGYYSIGNNSEKLNISNESSRRDSFIKAEKGYYNIGTNHRKLGRPFGERNAGYRRIPLVNKGYYSIGNNMEKLRSN